MCLAIPAQITEIGADHPDLATAEVDGVRRTVNVALVAEDGLVVGDWVLIHVGFAMSIIDEDEARRSLELLRTLGDEEFA
jgi:hydrogenase expression/formation protein HypC